ncbi:THADA, partial [Carabus blaptoides fortunei]
MLRYVQELEKTGAHLQHLLIAAIKLKPSILDSILSQWSVDNEVELSSLLKCTLITRKRDVKMKETGEKWRGLLDYSVLNLGMCHQNDEVRITSLALIAESRKSTATFTGWELKYIVTYLRYNINTQLPSTRQQIMSLMKKILIRFDAGYDTILRNYSKVPDGTKAEYFEQKTQYEEFIVNLRDCIFESLFPGANFSRRVICLETLTLLKPILLKLFSVENNLWTRTEAEAILLCLGDSYESNKKLAASLLAQCAPELMKLSTIEDTERFIQDALALAASVKPADTVTAAYMLETAGYSPVLRDTLLKLRPAKETRTPEYHMIVTVLQQLQAEVEIGKENLLRAAAMAPMHGTLFCLRHLMDKYLFKSPNNQKSSYWKPLVSEIITTCFEVCAIVGPI